MSVTAVKPGEEIEAADSNTEAVAVPLKSLVELLGLSHSAFSRLDASDIEPFGGPIRRAALKLHRAIERLVIAGREQSKAGRRSADVIDGPGEYEVAFCGYEGSRAMEQGHRVSVVCSASTAPQCSWRGDYPGGGFDYFDNQGVSPGGHVRLRKRPAGDEPSSKAADSNKPATDRAGKIPLRSENPDGLHARYKVQKVDAQGNVIPRDPDAFYFVLRLDDKGSDPEHTAACREAARAYCAAVPERLAGLRDDLLRHVDEFDRRAGVGLLAADRDTTPAPGLLAERVVAFLNELLERDRPAIAALFSNHLPCNAALADHPTLPVGSLNGGFYFGVLGLLNGICGLRSCGRPGPICAVLGEPTEDGDVRPLLRFSLTPTEGEVSTRQGQVIEGALWADVLSMQDADGVEIPFGDEVMRIDPLTGEADRAAKYPNGRIREGADGDILRQHVVYKAPIKVEWCQLEAAD